MPITMLFCRKEFKLDEHGDLAEFNENWSVGLAIELTKRDRLELTETHLEIIYFLREYYEKYQIAPTIIILLEEIGKSEKDLLELFPDGLRQACRIAGLPNPTGMM